MTRYRRNAHAIKFTTVFFHFTKYRYNFILDVIAVHTHSLSRICDVSNEAPLVLFV